MLFKSFHDAFASCRGFEFPQSFGLLATERRELGVALDGASGKIPFIVVKALYFSRVESTGCCASCSIQDPALFIENRVALLLCAQDLSAHARQPEGLLLLVQPTDTQESLVPECPASQHGLLAFQCLAHQTDNLFEGAFLV